MVAAEFGVEPMGLEYLEFNVNFANEVSRELGFPEFVRLADATVPNDITDADGAMMFCLLDSMPRVAQMPVLRNTFRMLKPGGYLYIEDVGFK